MYLSNKVTNTITTEQGFLIIRSPFNIKISKLVLNIVLSKKKKVLKFNTFFFLLIWCSLIEERGVRLKRKRNYYF